MKILITGATGFIGQRLVRKLLSADHTVYILVRKKSMMRAIEKFSDLPQVKLIEGDIQHTDVIANFYIVSNIIDQIDCVIHMAALYEIAATDVDTYMVNVVGTQNILNLLKKMKSLKYFHYFSTYAVNSIEKGEVSEDFLFSDNHIFKNQYSKTKNDAEFLVRKNMVNNVKTIIHRPGIVIGDSITGHMDKVDGPYYLFQFLSKNKKFLKSLKHLGYLPLPINNSSIFPILPVDVLVDWSSEIINYPPQRNLSCYHLITDEEVSTHRFIELTMKELDIPLTVFPLKSNIIFAPIFKKLNIPHEIIFYMLQNVRFNNMNFKRDYPNLTAPKFENYFPKIIQNFVKGSYERNS